MDISIAPETVFHLGPLAVSNSMLTAALISLALIVAGFALRQILRRIPGRLQSGLELAYEGLEGLATSIVGNADAARDVLPYILTLFVFILASNWSGLVPGFGTLEVAGTHLGKAAEVPLFRAPTSDLNTTIALALISVGYVQYLGLKYAGFKGYLGRFVSFKNPVAFFVGILEIIGELARIISFSFRLFGNIFAGEVLISVMLFLTASLLPYVPIIPLPFFFLELFVGVIQAFVFCFLTLLFVSLAVVSHDAEGHGQPAVAH